MVLIFVVAVIMYRTIITFLLFQVLLVPNTFGFA